MKTSKAAFTMMNYFRYRYFRILATVAIPKLTATKMMRYVIFRDVNRYY
ncbi:MAG: hypothetical protein Q9M40_13705 [Sulfurimonas sp.]|nr:hypothetical protein [Sulfurimonas sp.]